MKNVKQPQSSGKEEESELTVSGFETRPILDGMQTMLKLLPTEEKINISNGGHQKYLESKRVFDKPTFF